MFILKPRCSPFEPTTMTSHKLVSGQRRKGIFRLRIKLKKTCSKIFCVRTYLDINPLLKELQSFIEFLGVSVLSVGDVLRLYGIAVNVIIGGNRRLDVR